MLFQPLYDSGTYIVAEQVIAQLANICAAVYLCGVFHWLPHNYDQAVTVN